METNTGQALSQAVPDELRAVLAALPALPGDLAVDILMRRLGVSAERLAAGHVNLG